MALGSVEETLCCMPSRIIVSLFYYVMDFFLYNQSFVVYGHIYKGL